MPTNPQGQVRLLRANATYVATTSPVTIYTVPDNYLFEVTQVSVCNTDTSVRTVTLKLGSRSLFNGTRLGLAGGTESTLDWSGCHILHSGDTISLSADANSVVEVVVSGGERKDE
jgi:hypothetical protein